MSKGRSGKMLGVGGTRSHLSRKQLRGGRGAGGGPGGTGRTDPQAQKRELLRKLQESRENGPKTPRQSG
ncbi:DUF6243 family protein [Streptomyces albidus (ex Kaewkla and Franco 2022)]|uniref:DUF6243 family protein n=1 Tax=Streptomyces albidus (ex Kaewkla and Franco 2022) TaxID=722709 RepID=UPI0015EEC194|nr:DUF6243 family protein [Streptomyces albidus (ex Kaewkla and Franco 2022)]